MDLVGTYPLDWGDNGTTDLMFSLNYNDTEFDSDPSAFLNDEDQADFGNFLSDWRGVFTARHTIGALTLLGRVNYYGEWENANNNNNGNPLNVQKMDATWFTDIEASYQINDMFKISVGGRNIFDEYPEKDIISDYCCGRIYSSGSNVDWQGAWYYGRITVTF